MTTKLMVLTQTKQILFGILVILILPSLTGCGNSRQDLAIESFGAGVKQATETPIELSRETNPASVRPIEAKLELSNNTVTEVIQPLAQDEPADLPPIHLPLVHVEQLEAIALSRGIEFSPLARENTAIYALPKDEGGVVFFLTPTIEPLDFSSKELAADPAWFSNQMLGGLSVVRQVDNDLPALPPGDYVLTLSDDASQVIFSGAEQEFGFDAVIRALPRQAWLQPIAVITAREMCLSWIITQVCALIDTPLPSQLTGALRDSTNRLIPENGESFFDFDLSLPDIMGISARQRCEIALNDFASQERPGPDYAGCWATLTGAPAKITGFPIPPTLVEEPGTIEMTGISVFNVFEDVGEEVFCNQRPRQRAIGECAVSGEPPVPQAVAPPARLPMGEYLVIHVRSETDPEVISGVTGTRIVLFNSPTVSFVMPSFDGVTVIGDIVRGEGPAAEEEVSIAINFRSRVCMFWECRWVPRRGSWWSRWWR